MVNALPRPTVFCANSTSASAGIRISHCWLCRMEMSARSRSWLYTAGAHLTPPHRLFLVFFHHGRSSGGSTYSNLSAVAIMVCAKAEAHKCRCFYSGLRRQMTFSIYIVGLCRAAIDTPFQCFDCPSSCSCVFCQFSVRQNLTAAPSLSTSPSNHPSLSKFPLGFLPNPHAGRLSDICNLVATSIPHAPVISEAAHLHYFNVIPHKVG